MIKSTKYYNKRMRITTEQNSTVIRIGTNDMQYNAY